MHAAQKIDGLYVHVPFCDGKCHYCAFYSVPYTRDLATAWLAAIKQELDQEQERFGLITPSSIFMGGGTPSILPTDQLESLLSILCPHGIAAGDHVEWTSEANPGSLTSDKLKIMKAHGVNRISLGVQALTDPVLKQLGRRHTVADIYGAVNAIDLAGITNWGLDLIACIPGVSEMAWQKTLEAALAMAPKHLSVYSLTREEGTRLYHECETGAIRLLDDDEQLRMLEMAEAILGADGFERYEISNYARPGFECRHNLSCWRGDNYLGIGCAAASRVGNQRWTNPANISAYIGGRSIREQETLSPMTDAVERLVFGMRMREGVDLQAILTITGMERSEQAVIWQQSLARLERNHLVEQQTVLWRLTSKGLNLSDYVAVELMP